MKTDFKVGQKLICVDFTGMDDPKKFGLEPGKVLTVKRVKDNTFVSGGQTLFFEDLVLGNDGPWHSVRFEPYLGPPIIEGTTLPINDYECKACKNTKCSKTEKSCWKCGEPIKS